MNWADIGGRTKVLHVVVKWNYGISINILCKHHIAWRTRVKEGDRQLPHCLQCIDVLKKLMLEGKVNYLASTEILASIDMSGRRGR